MSTWEERLQAETEELQVKIEQLATFTRSQVFAEMNLHQRAVLIEQLGLEFQLMAVLMRRLGAD